MLDLEFDTVSRIIVRYLLNPLIVSLGALLKKFEKAPVFRTTSQGSPLSLSPGKLSD